MTLTKKKFLTVDIMCWSLDTQHYDIQHNDTKPYEIKLNCTQHKLHKMLSVVVLIVAYAECIVLNVMLVSVGSVS